jgi:hypothetical protein
MSHELFLLRVNAGSPYSAINCELAILLAMALSVCLTSDAKCQTAVDGGFLHIVLV